MNRTTLPSVEEFIPIDVRPACPICGYDMIHTRIEFMGEDGLCAFNAWICTCENTEESLTEEISEARLGIPAESLVITVS